MVLSAKLGDPDRTFDCLDLLGAEAFVLMWDSTFDPYRDEPPLHRAAAEVEPGRRTDRQRVASSAPASATAPPTESCVASSRLRAALSLPETYLKYPQPLFGDPPMPRKCSVCNPEQRESIDQDLLSGTPYRSVGKRYGVGTSAVFRHKRDHITQLIAQAVEAREVRGLEHGDDLLGQLQSLNGRAMSILDDAETSGDRRGALAAIREVRNIIELNAKLCGQIREQHLHLHGHQMLTPEAAEQFVEAMSTMEEVLHRLPAPGSIRDDVHLLSGKDALPKPSSFEESELP